MNPELPSDVPKELVQPFIAMTVSMQLFTRNCKQLGMHPDRCYAGVVSAFITQFRREERELVTDIIAHGTNIALKNWQKFPKK